MGSQLITVEASAAILSFWFEELCEEHWFKADAALDAMIRARFLAVHEAACQGELWPWRATPQGRLAEILVLDQFSRNLYRDDPKAYAADPMALALAQEALSVNADTALENQQKLFLYMPFMHSESLEVHDIAYELFSAPGLEQHLAYENQHRKLLLEFGRYPQRNAVLGRPSSEAELRYLSAGSKS
ncbi:DUF924 domain-containing protein [Alteromonas aestuariivivens]|uniref:DUF924 domain-containing protein n=1 Tax=Alteromonas aestuariivivens TaxID=1938339 RepID=A0A3D8MBL0_9ALTE|nr:DUF924 family protein [Alteromonas aestuariivivens]RDV27521.1 DUF924 domain-containing protein [Alteromonas aestuariivivens]